MLIELGDISINVIINRKKIKNIYFKFNDNLELCVSANHFVSLKEIKKLIIKNEKSILKLYNRALEEQEKNNYFSYLGNSYIKIFDEKMKLKDTYFDEKFVYVKNEKALESFYKKECLKIFTSRVENIKYMFTDLPDFTLKIRFMKTRWGVCNFVKKTVTLNSELLKKETTLIDYVIIHELCHFYHHDHSKSFWKKVSEYYPYYKQARKMLREV